MSCALVRINPIATLHQTEHKDALVDEITTVIAELKTVAGFDRPSPEYEGPSGEIDPWGLQGNGQICREQSEIY